MGSFAYNPVHRDLFPRTNYHDITYLHFLYQDVYSVAVPDNPSSLYLEPDELLDRL
jgi:hypothetical protein